MENNRLRWYYQNQKLLRLEVYQELSDITSEEDADFNQIDQRKILLLSFTESSRYLQQLY